MSLQSFTEEARGWLSRHCPPGLRGRTEPVTSGGRKQPLDDPDGLPD
jgi:hypothetical protein